MLKLTICIYNLLYDTKFFKSVIGMHVCMYRCVCMYALMDGWMENLKILILH